MRAADGSLMGQAYGWTWGGTCHIRYLFVPADMRKRGHGTMLMCAAEKEAKTLGCRQIVLETHDFQAPEFYQGSALKSSAMLRITHGATST